MLALASISCSGVCNSSRTSSSTSFPWCVHQARVGAVQVEKHDSRESVWFVHDGKVYDGTKFLKEHPGGAESILMVGGQDATEEFNAIHSSKAKSMLADYMIGQVGNAAEAQDDVAPERAPIDKQVSRHSLTFAGSKMVKPHCTDM